MPCVCDMPSIKQYLKEVGITQKVLAERIGLSRPTLDTYIDLYESGQTIPKERYDIIFKRLFEGGNLSAEDFEIKLQQAEGLLERDQKYGTIDLEPEAADYVSAIIRNMNKDLRQENWNEDVYIFINILISNYRNNEIFNQLVEYFIYLNGIRETDTIKEKQIPYFANMFRAFRNLVDNSDAYEEQDYKKFLNRCAEIREHKKKAANEKENTIKDRLQQLISEYEKKGIDLSEEELIEAISNQIANEKTKGKND